MKLIVILLLLLNLSSACATTRSPAGQDTSVSATEPLVFTAPAMTAERPQDSPGLVRGLVPLKATPDEAAKFCTDLGLRLPTAREVADWQAQLGLGEVHSRMVASEINDQCEPEKDKPNCSSFNPKTNAALNAEIAAQKKLGFDPVFTVNSWGKINIEFYFKVTSDFQHMYAFSKIQTCHESVPGPTQPRFDIFDDYSPSYFWLSSESRPGHPNYFKQDMSGGTPFFNPWTYVAFVRCVGDAESVNKAGSSFYSIHSCDSYHESP